MRASSAAAILILSLVGVQAVPLNLGQVLGVKSSSNAPAPTNTYSGSTPLNLINVLSGLGIQVPTGLTTTTNGIDFTALSDLDLDKALRNLLLDPRIKIPKGTDVNTIIKNIIATRKNSLFPLLPTYASTLPAAAPTNLLGGILNLGDVKSNYVTPSGGINLNPTGIKAAIAPYISVAPSVGINNGAGGPLGIIGVDVGLTASVFGAKATVTPKINI
ncbi:hypothetical protein IAU60_005789 [Kwoniella sp. DSM 27419]